MKRRRHQDGRPSLPPAGPELAVAGLVLLLALSGPKPAAAQERSFHFEARAGAVYASALAETPVRLSPGQDFSDIGHVEMGAGVAPFLGGGILFDAGYLVWAELQGGVSWRSLEGEGPLGTWDAGSLTRFHATGGLRVGLGEGLYVRGAVGFIVQSASELPVFLEGDDTGILLGAAAGYQPVERLPVSVEIEAQRFDFGTTALRRSGGADGAVGRVLLTLAWRQGSGVER